MANPPTSFKELNWKVNGRLFGFGTSPEADWKIIFNSALILVVIMIIMDVFVFIKINRGEIFLVERPKEQRNRTLDIAILKETVSYYQNKALEFERIKKSVAPAVDPSILVPPVGIEPTSTP